MLIKKYTLRMKTTKIEKVCFIKMNEIKLTQVELFSIFHCMCVAADASKLFCMSDFANTECFLYHCKLSF